MAWGINNPYLVYLFSMNDDYIAEINRQKAGTEPWQKV